mmetsp:Transcript_33652/g.95190  ORF Transcript_33652/g.95190 Transcript_33652/m.95190 type:complete len:567 (-) Transcript_33652:3018-4718(-)
MEGRKPLLSNQLGHHLSDMPLTDPIITYELQQPALRGKKTSVKNQILGAVGRNKYLAACLALVAITAGACVLLPSRAAELSEEEALSTAFEIPHMEESAVDLYTEDASWIKETERKFRDEERLRERLIQQAKREQTRQALAAASKRKGRGKNKRRPPHVAVKPPSIVIPPSTFPEYKPKPRVTEAQREKELLEEQQRQDEAEALKREMEAAEYKYLLTTRVKAPLTIVPNCYNCKAPEVVGECRQLPRSLRSTALDDEEEEEEGGGGQGEGEGFGRRRLSFTLKRMDSTNQLPFDEPADMTQNIVKRMLGDWKADPGCSFWTRKCVRKSQREIRVLPFEQGPEEFFSGHVLPEDGDHLFPNLYDGDLGTCALVGSGANLIGKQRGWEIDQHDTVLRFMDAPIEGFETDVGNKTTVAIIKAGMSHNEEVLHALKTRRAALYSFQQARDWRNLASRAEEETFQFLGRRLLWPTPLAEQATKKVYNIYLAGTPAFSVQQKQMPTSGFRYLMGLIASRLCLRIDAYGFAAAGGGRYHNPNDFLSTSHVSGLEHWVYRQASAEQMNVCLYD